MGYQTAFMILNDSGDDVKKHPEQVVENIYNGLLGVGSRRTQSATYSIGNSANPMKVFSPQHADTPQLLMAYQNDFIRFGYGSDLTEERTLAYRKRNLQVAKAILEDEERIIKELEAKTTTK